MLLPLYPHSTTQGLIIGSMISAALLQAPIGALMVQCACGLGVFGYQFWRHRSMSAGHCIDSTWECATDHLQLRVPSGRCAHHDDRRTPRAQPSRDEVSAFIVLSDGEHDVEVIDLSAIGMRLRLPAGLLDEHALAKPLALSVQLPGELPCVVWAQVRWRSSQPTQLMLGVAFEPDGTAPLTAAIGVWIRAGLSEQAYRQVS
ncbi:MAG: hypothetical protein ACI8S6_001965 [Myxococcota bacterium]|jgi:hypothetical protein